MKTIATIQGVPVYQHEDGHLSWLSKCAIDNDGSGGNPEHDPAHQDETTLKHRNGTSLNAQTESFIVVPPAIVRGVSGIVMGCKARVHYRKTGDICDAVVGDLGPSDKIGEASVKCAKMLGMNPSPISGGEDGMDQVLFECWPGIPAVVDGVLYPLQPS